MVRDYRSIAEERGWSEAHVLLMEGRDHLAERNFEAAMRLFLESAKADPSNKALELAGECAVELGRRYESILYAAAAVGLNRAVQSNRMVLARAFLLNQRPEDAAQLLRETIAMAPTHGPAKRLLAKLEAELRDRSQEEDES